MNKAVNKSVNTSVNKLVHESSRGVVHALLDAVADALVIIDGQAKILVVNRAAEQIFGYGASEMVGNNVSMLMPQTDARLHDGYLQAYMQTGQRKVMGLGRDVFGLRNNGEVFPMHLSLGEGDLDGDQVFVGVCHDISNRVALQQRAARLAEYDRLTGCLNRDAFSQRLSQLVVSGKYPTLGLMYVDLSGFKQINNHFGHRVGDHVLAAFGERLKGLFSGEDVLLGRAGGDEFVVLVPGLVSRFELNEQAARLASAVLEPLVYDAFHVLLDCKIGCAFYPEDADAPDTLMHNADLAMYRAKGQSATRWVHYDAEFGREAARRSLLLQRLRTARVGAELDFVYQLKTDLLNHKPVGMEALMRWVDPLLGAVSPAEFIPVAESSGTIGKWTFAMLVRACQANQSLREAGVLDVPVSVNISAHQFFSSGFTRQVIDALEATGLPGNRLDLELTESVMVHDFERARGIMTALKLEGITFSLDDFGTGFSSLGALDRLDFDFLKIDKAFIDGITAGGGQKAIVDMILALGRAMKISTVAEGIENAQQAEILTAMGCNQGQGYYFARPVALGALAEAVRASPVSMASINSSGPCP